MRAKYIFVVAFLVALFGCETTKSVVAKEGDTIEAKEKRKLREREKKVVLSDAEVRRALSQGYGTTNAVSVKNGEGTMELEKKCVKKLTLSDFTDASNRRRPLKNEIYEYDGDDLRVFQVNQQEADGDCPAFSWVLVTNDDFVLGHKLLLGVINEREYVTSELLESGKYRYVGPYTYATSPVVEGVEQQRTNTIRLFVEVGSEIDKFIQNQNRE